MLKVQRHAAQDLTVAKIQLEVCTALEAVVRTLRVRDSTKERTYQENTA